MKRYTRCNQNEKLTSSYYKSNTIVPGLGDGYLTYNEKGGKKTMQPLFSLLIKTFFLPFLHSAFCYASTV